MDGDFPRFEIEIEQDAVVADSASPRRRLSLEALQIALEGVRFHRKQRGFNACLLFWRELFVIFLRGTRDRDVPSHGGMPSMIPHLLF